MLRHVFKNLCQSIAYYRKLFAKAFPYRWLLAVALQMVANCRKQEHRKENQDREANSGCDWLSRVLEQSTRETFITGLISKNKYSPWTNHRRVPISNSTDTFRVTPNEFETNLSRYKLLVARVLRNEVIAWHPWKARFCYLFLVWYRNKIKIVVYGCS